MMTRRLDVLGDHSQAVEDAASLLRNGGLVAFPTETVYGLGALGLDPEALEKIFMAKERPHDDPLILHLAEAAWMDELAVNVPEMARRLVESLWPGPLTVVLTKSERVPDLATAGLPSVAMRMPAHPVAHSLITKVGAPLAAPSANRFGRTSPTTAEHVLQDLGGRIDAVLDAGPTRVGVESTVIDMRDPDHPLILRPGGTTREAIEEAIGRRVELRSGGPTVDAGPTVSPGLLLRHYSPRASLRLYPVSDSIPERMLVAIAEQARLAPGRVGALAYDEDLPALEALPVDIAVLGSIRDFASVARNLFGALRRLDAEGHAVIFARLTTPDGLGEAVNDRLTRAASGVIEQD